MTLSFVPDLHVLAAYTAAAFVLIFTPGPDMTFFLGQTLAAGRARGLAAMLGVSAGVVVHSIAAAFGLSALLAASATAFGVLKIAGVAYLIFLAVQALRKGAAFCPQQAATDVQPLSRVFLLGFGINLLNPKIILFFLTFLPQFVAGGDPHAAGKLMFLGFYFIALGIPTCAMLILLAERFTAAIRRSPRAMRGIDYLFAGLMGAFAIRLLLARTE